MKDQEARYDRIAEGYAAWWAPIHRPATLGLLEEIAPALDAGATRVLDIGCGTGALVAEIATRWPAVHVTGVDLSGEMLAIAARTVHALPQGAGDRVTLVQAPAEALPVADASFDVAVSAFVLQLVPSRARMLREARRVLGPGGTVATVTWMRGGTLAADEAYDEALLAAGLDPRRPRESGSGGRTAAAGRLRGRPGSRRPGQAPVHPRGVPRLRAVLRRRGAVRVTRPAAA